VRAGSGPRSEIAPGRRDPCSRARPHSIAFVSGNLSLFGDEPPDELDQPVPTEASIADWLVDDIRAALTARGLATMAERQHAIEAAVKRPVESLRSLTRAEALSVLSLLASTPAPQKSQTSAWDDRDEETWIDRL
jgi:hypothetical protein